MLEAYYCLDRHQRAVELANRCAWHHESRRRAHPLPPGRRGLRRRLAVALVALARWLSPRVPAGRTSAG